MGPGDSRSALPVEVPVNLRHGAAMTVCGREAVLLITVTPVGTSTNVVRSRTELRCSLPSAHEGSHRDAERGETWDQAGDARKTLLRHETDEP